MKIKSVRIQFKRQLISGLLVIACILIGTLWAIELNKALEMDSKRLSSIGSQIEIIFKRALILERELNHSLLDKASSSAVELLNRYNRWGETRANSLNSEYLYTIVDGSLTVLASNRIGQGEPFQGERLLKQLREQSLDDFQKEHEKLVSNALKTGTVMPVPINILEPDSSGVYGLYKPFSNAILIEVLIPAEAELTQIRAFVVASLDQLIHETNLAGLSVYSADRRIYAKGVELKMPTSDRSAPNQRLKQLLIPNGSSDITILYRSNVPVFLQELRSFMIFSPIILGLLFVLFLVLTEGRRKRLFEPIAQFAQYIKEAANGRYDRRLGESPYADLQTIHVAFNDKMESIEQTLDSRKMQEYQLRQTLAKVQQEFQAETTLLENAQIQLRDLHASVSRAEEDYINMVLTISAAIDVRDRFSSGHCQRVMETAVQIAILAGLKDEALESVRIGALLHDVGILSINEDILNKLGPLNEQEKQHVQRHTRFGEEMIVDMAVSPEIKQIVLSHHERYDGFGYPNHIRGNHIPIGARIVALADAFDAMTHPRPYRTTPMTQLMASEEINRYSGKQFDPELVIHFNTWLKNQKGETP